MGYLFTLQMAQQPGAKDKQSILFTDAVGLPVHFLPLTVKHHSFFNPPNAK